MQAITSPQILAATLVILLGQAEQVPLEIAQEHVFKLPMVELLDAISVD